MRICKNCHSIIGCVDKSRTITIGDETIKIVPFCKEYPSLIYCEDCYKELAMTSKINDESKYNESKWIPFQGSRKPKLHIDFFAKVSGQTYIEIEIMSSFVLNGKTMYMNQHGGVYNEKDILEWQPLPYPFCDRAKIYY